MPRLTVTISDEHERILEEQSDGGEAFRSKSEVVRECIEAYERVEDLSNQMACLEAEVDMLREQREQLKQKAARVDELETKLRKLQMEYHTLISEGKSPTELEPKIDTTLELETETAVAEDGSEKIEATQPKAVTESVEPVETTTAGSENAETTAETVETSPGRKTAVSRSGTTENRSGTPVNRSESTAGNANSGGVEIDEELLYQSPGVGSRLKSALFGGPGSSR